MIDLKFNELAKRIFEELNQSQYSEDFFHAIDDILSEPVRQKHKHQHQQQLQRRRALTKKVQNNSYNDKNNNRDFESNMLGKKNEILDQRLSDHTIWNNQKSQKQNNISTGFSKVQQQQQYQQQRFNPIVRSSTVGNADFVKRPSIKQRSGHGHEALNSDMGKENNIESQDREHSTRVNQLRYNRNMKSIDSDEPLSPVKELSSSTPNYREASLSIVSNGSSSGQRSIEHQAIKSLYKPHMNYSTSALGSHRLSDDDEIIIIPTKSPSLISSSPDRESSNATDEHLQDIERFSISRTKNFWEKLSNTKNTNEYAGQAKSLPATNNNGNYTNKRNSLHGHLTDNESFTNNNNSDIIRSPFKQSQNRFRQGSGVVRSKTLNSHDYSSLRDQRVCRDQRNGDSWTDCKDEHGPSPNSASLVSQLLQLSRENKFRQTR